MNNKEIYDFLNNMNMVEIKTLISISLEYLENVYNEDINLFLKNIKKLHKELKKHNKGANI